MTHYHPETATTYLIRLINRGYPPAEIIDKRGILYYRIGRVLISHYEYQLALALDKKTLSC